MWKIRELKKVDKDVLMATSVLTLRVELLPNLANALIGSHAFRGTFWLRGDLSKRIFIAVFAARHFFTFLKL